METEPNSITKQDQNKSIESAETKSIESAETKNEHRKSMIKSLKGFFYFIFKLKIK